MRVRVSEAERLSEDALFLGEKAVYHIICVSTCVIRAEWGVFIILPSGTRVYKTRVLCNV